MKVEKQSGPVRDRILATAFDLFYRQGCRATGINQIIAESGVAKASFYHHFPSKSDLLLAYAREMARREFDDMRVHANAQSTPQARFMAPLGMLKQWFKDTDYRGCPFQNLMGEMAAEVPAVQVVAEQHRENVRSLVRSLFEDWAKCERRLKKRNAQNVADTYLILLEGAIATAVAYQDGWPVDHAMATLKRHIGLA